MQLMRSTFSEARSFIDRYGQIIRNMTWLGMASLLVKPFWFAFITVFCVRLLGDEGYGIMMTALSFAYLVFSFTGLGIETYIVREVAGDRSEASRFFSNFLILRSLLILFAIVAAIISGWLLNYTSLLLAAVLFASLYLAALNFTSYLNKFFQAFEVLKYQAISEVFEKIVVMGGGTLLLLLTHKPHWTLFGMALGMALTGLLSAYWVTAKFARFNRDFLSTRFILDALPSILPLGLAGFFGMVHFRVDTVMVEAFLGAVPAGHYGLAFRIVEALNMVPVIIVHATLYPRLSSLFRSQDYREFRRLIKIGAAVLLAISLPISLGISVTAPFLVQLISGDPSFAPAASALRWLCWIFPLTCLTSILYVSLITMNRLRAIFISLGIVTVINITLNIWLIPAVGINGAVVTTIIAEALLLTLYAAGIGRGQHETATSDFKSTATS